MRDRLISPFNFEYRISSGIDERFLHTLTFCNMNCGVPILLDVSAIHRESTTNEVFKDWLEHGGEIPAFDIHESCTPNSVWEIAEKYRQRYLKQVSIKYQNFDMEDSIRRILDVIKHRIVVETSTTKMLRNPVIVVTRPLYDFATWYTYAWQDKVIKEALNRGYEVLDLGLQYANRKNLEIALVELQPIFYFHSGHGNESCILGHLGEKIVEEKNCNILKDCQANIVACRTAELLGKLAVDQGCIVYFGYNKNFLFVTQWNAMEHELSRLYKIQRERGYITWKDIREIKDATRKLMVRSLEHDRESATLIGDKTVRTRHNS